MKNKFYLLMLVGLLALLSACNNTLENEVLNTKVLNIEEKTAVTEEINGNERIMLLPVNPDSIKSRLFKTDIMTRSINPMAADYDMYFSSNMYAIDGLPFTLKAREGNKYLSAIAKWEEVKWSTTATTYDQKFYVKVLPASTGIPYLIYSYKTKTPIGVGQYTNNPDEKILLVHKDESGSLYNAAWDFIPSPSYPGHYAIESQSHIGQSDPNNPWSIFYHVIEVKDKNRVRYGKYIRKAQQEFIIKPDAVFTLKNVEFVNAYNAKVTSKANFAITRSWSNPESRAIMKDFVFEEFVDEYSNFTENKTIAFNVAQSTIFFRRPAVTKDEIDFVPDLSKSPDTYYRPYQTIKNRLYAVVPLRIAPKTKLYATYYFKTFDVEVDYIATIEYGGKEAKITGRWKGLIHVDEIFEVDTDPVDLSTNFSRGIERIRVTNIAKQNSFN